MLLENAGPILPKSLISVSSRNNCLVRYLLSSGCNNIVDNRGFLFFCIVVVVVVVVV